MRNTDDTIAAVATANGEGGIAIVRISGKDALPITGRMFVPSNKRARLTHSRMVYGYIKDEAGRDIDEVMAVYFASPRSYTRQDVCEIHTHGGISAERVLERAVKLGARPAERGEFTYRAFVNGRISLEKAEAVMNLISSGSARAARNSIRQLKSGVSSRIGACREKLLELVSLIDAATDFPDEIDETLTVNLIKERAREIAEELKKSADPAYARIVSEGARVVIAGRPNVGKSSIMNRILCSERSIVTEIPGTTRDVINESVRVNGLKLTLTDTAGIRDTDDAIESIGVDRAQKCVEEADCVILVLDASNRLSPEDAELISKKDDRYIIVANKDDIRDENAEIYKQARVSVSARTGEGIDALMNLVYEKVSPGEDDDKLLTLRHIDCANRALQALERLEKLSEGEPLELMREELTDALYCLGEISGENIGETVIDSIFERFCVGK